MNRSIIFLKRVVVLFMPLILFSCAFALNDANKNERPIVEIPLGIKTVLDLPVEKDVQPNFEKKNSNEEQSGCAIAYVVVDENGNVIFSEILKSDFSFLKKPILNSLKETKFKSIKIEEKIKKAQFLKLFKYPKSKKFFKVEVVFSNLRLPNIIAYTLPKFINGAQGKVVEVQVEHNLYGVVKKVKVLKGESEIINHEVVKALKKWIHEPLIGSGVPSNMEYVVRISFDSPKKVEAVILYQLQYEKEVSLLKGLLDTVKE